MFDIDNVVVYHERSKIKTTLEKWNFLMRQIYLVLSICILTLYSAIAVAHGGGLNSAGCHNNRKTGGYHCHRSSYTPSYKSSKPKSSSYSSQYKASPTPQAESITPLKNYTDHSFVTVLKLQIYLDLMGFDTGEIDGILGNKTKTAIESFKIKNRIGRHVKSLTYIMKQAKVKAESLVKIK